MQRDRRCRHRLSPYHRHHLTPPTEDLPVAALEGSPGVLECEHLNMHYVSEVRTIPACVPFTVLQEWPVPWDMVLTPWERFVMKHYMRVCVCCATIDVEPRQVIRGYERWVIHCHCKQPGSLQCKAGGVVLTNWFKMLVFGALVNVRFPWYPQVVNYELPKEVMYMGSVCVRGRHLIYLRILYDGHAAAVLEFMSFGWSVFSFGILNNMVVMGCTYCKDLTEIQVRCCARRTRRLLIKAVRFLNSSPRRGAFRRSLGEPRRQQLLRGLMEHHRPFTLSQYDRGENPWRA
ncbi:34K [Simian adenovirus 17]|uniref:34K n=1 Tax=Simian adenovirus 17 TaxID=1715779 RepID=A0A2H4CK08_9ADEN|nr:34K [Simian adenovirus 17]